MEEHAVQVIVVVLTSMGQNYIKVFPSLVDDRCQADDFRAGTNNDEQFQLAIILILTTLIISKKPGNTGISRDIRTEFTTDLLLSD